MARVEELSKLISGMKFGVISPNEIRRLSVVEIVMADTYDEDGIPITSGLMDGRFGTLEPRQRCKTCGNTATRCPGHFGHIELALPVNHPAFAKLVHNILNSTCKNCGRILLSDNEIAGYKNKIETKKEMLGTPSKSLYKQILDKAKKNKTCPYCGAAQSVIKFNKPTVYSEVFEKKSNRLTPSMIRERLERILDDDLKLLGLDPESARPEWMVLQVLPVPPVYVRPSITLQTGIRSEDDLTHKLVDIIRINQRLKENIDVGAPALIVQDLAELLQYHITTYFNNESSGIPPARHRSGRALKTLSQRLKGKEGRFRSNLSGKRVDFSARTVISPDPFIGISEVGVPIEIVKRLTVPSRVTRWNIEELKALVRNGPDNYPGALYVVRPDEKRIRLEFVTEHEKVAESLQIGFIVERHLINGDIVIFNRQPSLHRMSIMAHRVKVLPYKTFRLNLCVCPPYNADFDGDEMNLHVPQSEEAQTESALLMRVQDQMLSPRYGGPIIGAIRDFISAAYMLTKDDTRLNKRDVERLLIVAGYRGSIPEPSVKEPEPFWTGKEIFSIFLPKGFNYVLKASMCQLCPTCKYENCEHDAYVIVKDGFLESGVIDKNSIGAEKSESLYHRLVKDYGTDFGRWFLNSISRLLNEFLSMKGFTYSLDELELSSKAGKKVDDTITKMNKKVLELINNSKNNTLPRLPGQTLNESLEIYIMNELAKARDACGNVSDEYFSVDNHGIIMTRTGARGSSLNIGQMTAALGQQAVRGKRIIRGYTDRSLPHFVEGDQSPRARGFVGSCYRDGLDPIEFFFHAMGGREGLVDTAVRTQQSGYMQRRLINALEHLRVEHDGTVRDSEGNIIEFRYGEDGIDPAKSDHGKAVNIERLVDAIRLAFKEDESLSKKYVDEQLQKHKAELTPLLISELEIQALKARLSKKAFDDLINRSVKNYKSALVEPGEAVGIVAAQSIGEPGTQMTLRTFHYAGVRERNVTLGLPRLIEIVDARKSPSTPIMSVYLNAEYNNVEKATEIAKELVYTTVKDVSSKIYFDPVKTMVVVKLNIDAMESRGINENNFKNISAFSALNVDVSDDYVFINYPTRQNPDRSIKKVSTARVRGIPGIRRALIVNEGGEWMINTDGSNISKVLRIPGVDPIRTTTNNIHDIAETLGIEAARNMLIKEATGVLDEQGLDVDIRHVMLVADTMTSTGKVLQIGRHGVSGHKSSIIARAAFEITVPTLVDAAARGMSDMFRGATESVIVGQNIPVGTGAIEIYMGFPKNSSKNKKIVNGETIKLMGD